MIPTIKIKLTFKEMTALADAFNTCIPVMAFTEGMHSLLLGEMVVLLSTRIELLLMKGCARYTFKMNGPEAMGMYIFWNEQNIDHLSVFGTNLIYRIVADIDKVYKNNLNLKQWGNTSEASGLIKI